MLAVRFDNWKVVFMEQRVQGTLQIWAEPFVHLRVPKLFNLRTDPFERADITSNTYYDWLLESDYIVLAATFITSQFLQTFVEFPPRQEAASFTIDQVVAKLESVLTSGQVTRRRSGIAAATFRMGSDAHYAEEAPSRRVEVDGFWIDRVAGHQRRYAEFVADTGYVTVAERPLDPAAFPGAPPENLVPGSLVFTRTRGPVDLRHINQWWTWTPGACWRQPEGPGSSLAGREEHPVVHVAYEDATAFADWAGQALPTEAQWELAARGGLDGAAYVWGDEPEPRRRPARQLLARRLPLAAGAGLRDDRAGRLVRTQRLRAPRHGRQRLGVDRGLVRRQRGGEPRPVAAAVRDPAQGRQGRLVPVRRQLLPALPAGGAAAADDRHRHEPRGLPLRAVTGALRPAGAGRRGGCGRGAAGSSPSRPGRRAARRPPRS